MAISDAPSASEPKTRTKPCNLTKLLFISLPPFELSDKYGRLCSRRRGLRNLSWLATACIRFLRGGGFHVDVARQLSQLHVCLLFFLKRLSQERLCLVFL